MTLINIKKRSSVLFTKLITNYLMFGSKVIKHYKEDTVT